MDICRSRGIVLKVTGHGESDKIVTFYSPDLGRTAGIAKGAKRSKQRFVNKLEEFSLLDITYRPSRTGGLLFLSRAELKNPFLSLRTLYRRYIVAVLACELIIRFTGEHDSDPEIFSLLLWHLDAVDRGMPPLAATALFHLRLLGACGYRPELSRCSSCGHKVDGSRSFALQPVNGSLVCSSCNSHVRQSGFGLTLQTIKFLQTAQQMDLKHLERLQMSIPSARETLQVLYRYSQHLLQRDIHSWRFVDREAATVGRRLPGGENRSFPR
jgi:DNA repair protein RecO (recombination protein O)